MTSNDLSPISLPDAVADLCDRLQAPGRLVAHLTLVHDVAFRITSELASLLPALAINSMIVEMGAVVHDIGRGIHPAELTAAGSLHEVAGQSLLIKHGFPDEIARCARTHGRWSDEQLPLEELLVSLADRTRKGARCDFLEMHIIDLTARELKQSQWLIFQIVGGPSGSAHGRRRGTTSLAGDSVLHCW